MRWSLVLASLAGCFAKDTETQTIADPTARFAHSLVALPIGTDYLVKFNMTNTSILKKTVVGISATLVQDSKTVQTFPRAAVQKSVAPLGTVVLRYKLHAFANPGDYRLRVNTEFYDSDEEYSQVAIDAPVTLAYSDSLYDLQSIFMYIVLALGTAGTVWYMLKPTAEPSGSKSKRSKKQQQPRVDKQALEKASEELDMDWIPKQLVRQQEKANEPKKASKK